MARGAKERKLERDLSEIKGRALSRNETHDLGMIIRDRAKVLKAHVEHQAAIVLADFEAKMAKEYRFSDDAVWKKAAEEAFAAVKAAEEIVEKRCAELGIPPGLSPRIGAYWAGRGQDAVKERQTELRRAAKAKIDEMSKKAVLKIERQSLDLRTQVVAMGLLSDEARLFLESLATVEEAMQMLDFKAIEQPVIEDQSRRDETRRRFGI